MTTNEKQNKRPEVGKKELTPRQIQMRKKMVVFPLFFLAFAGCMWLIFSPGEKEREEPSAGFNTELPTPESEGILSDKRDAYVQEEMRRREREKMRSLQDFAFGMEDEEEEPVMPAAVPGSEELNAVKEIAANMGAGMGSSITITDDAGSQLLSDLGRSAIQGVSQYVSKKMRSVKVTLKAGYSVLLLPPLQ